ncbi:MAG: dihydropteroate synthase [Polyangiales bacterium]
MRGASTAPGADVRPAIVGVVNVTPDSFSDGGRFLEPMAARAHVDRLLDEGADVVEIGGESTRPAGATYGAGATKVDAATQIARIRPVIEYAVRERRALVAVDTTLVEVAEAALDAGATIVNDVSTLGDVALARLVAARGAWLVLMHARPGADSKYDDVIAEVAREWSAARDRAVAAGLDPARIVMDPGLGFGKGGDDNLRILAGLARFHALVGPHPIYVGASRKAFIGLCEERAALPKSRPDGRIGGTVAACLVAVSAGAAALRVHDVQATRQALAVATAIDIQREEMR